MERRETRLSMQLSIDDDDHLLLMFGQCEGVTLVVITIIVLTKLRLKLKIKKKHQLPILLDSAKSKYPASKQALSIELSNRFHLLNEIPMDDLDEYRSNVQDAFTNTGEQDIRKPRRNHDETCKLIEEMKRFKQGLLSKQGEQKIAAIAAHRAKKQLLKQLLGTNIFGRQSIRGPRSSL
ncbi:hypothetical protein ElyMa_001189800 [Elysia marginata]|uniref:Uncharacterized protein n=1 Tax=Elysia marginata TaxID=1093978 RepID=A0AAV4I464_9GAST|nr:hypothetical protein ElyMa_001189800 [Elysia marginata]